MKVLNYGSLNVDYVYKLDHIVNRGETILSSSRDVFSGGKGLNQSIALARAGVKVSHAGCLGAGGEFLKELLDENKVDTSHITYLPDQMTGHTVIQNSNDGDNCIILYGGTNQMVTEQQIDETLKDFGKGDYLIMQNEISNLPYLVQKAHKKGMILVLNPSPMNETILNLDLNLIDWFFLNEIEASQITGAPADNADQLILALRDRLPGAQVVLTMGSQGAYYLDKQDPIHLDAFKVKAVDTTAAGDTFSGYFIAAIIDGKAPKVALMDATKAAAIAVTRAGAAPSIPSREEVENFT